MGRERPGAAAGGARGDLAGRLGCHAKEVAFYLWCWAVLTGFTQQNDTVTFENHSVMCKFTCQRFSKMGSAGVFLQFPREGKRLAQRHTAHRGGFGIQVFPSPGFVSFLLMRASSAAPIRVRSLSTRLFCVLHFQDCLAHPSGTQECSCPEVWTTPGCAWRPGTACLVPSYWGDP